MIHSAELVVDEELRSLIDDFDHHSPTYVRRIHDVFRYLHTLPAPVFRANRYGGFWVFGGYHTLLEIQKRQDVFSNVQITIPDHTGTPPLIPAFQDPPNHQDYRRVLAKSLSPIAVNKLHGQIAEITGQLFDSVRDKQEFDVVLDIAAPLTGMMTMSVLGFDLAEFETLSQPFHDGAFDHGTYEERAAGFAHVIKRVKEFVGQQMNAPSEGFGQVFQSEFQGRKLTAEELQAMVLNILAGGLGTTQAFIGSVAVYLGRNEDSRQLLLDEPGLIGTTALPELLRHFPPTPTMAKKATQPFDIEGVHIEAGEMVLLAYGAANLDPAVFENPLKIDLRRAKNPIMTFGIGPHRCLGSHLGQAMAKVVISQLLERAPRYELIEERVEIAKSFAHVLGYRSVPVRPNHEH